MSQGARVQLCLLSAVVAGITVSFFASEGMGHSPAPVVFRHGSADSGDGFYNHTKSLAPVAGHAISNTSVERQETPSTRQTGALRPVAAPRSHPPEPERAPEPEPEPEPEPRPDATPLAVDQEGLPPLVEGCEPIRDCFASEAACREPYRCPRELFDRYPLSMEMLQKGYHGQHGSMLWPMIRKAENGEKVRIGVLGGSMTCGGYCGRYTGQTSICERYPNAKQCQKVMVGKPCSWAGRLEQWLQQIYPKRNVKVVNLCRAKTTSRWAVTNAVQLLGNEAWDLIIVDYMQNDGNQPNTGDLDDSGHASRRLTSVATEALVRKLHDRSNSTAMMYLVTMIPPLFNPYEYMWGPFWKGESARKLANIMWHFQESYKLVCDRYGIPWVSYQDVVWPDADTWPDKRFWMNPQNEDKIDHHPGQWTHQLISDTLQFAWQFERLRACGIKFERDQGMVNRFNVEPMFPAAELQSLNACGESTETVSAYVASNASRKDSGWVLTEDRPGEPGWIINGSVGDLISFPIMCGDDRTLVVEHLKSYENIGRVKMYVGEPFAQVDIQNRNYVVPEHLRTNPLRKTRRQHEIDGRWRRHGNTRTSLREVHVVRDKDMCEIDGMNRDVMMVSFELLPSEGRSGWNKFKLISLQSC